jgi:hypothetical protein
MYMEMFMSHSGVREYHHDRITRKMLSLACEQQPQPLWSIFLQVVGAHSDERGGEIEWWNAPTMAQLIKELNK